MMRLDMYLKEKLGSRQKAQEAIESGCVCVNSAPVCKSSKILRDDDKVSIDTQGLLCGRAGYKLRGFIEELKQIGVWTESYLAYKKALDIGSSTGGFTQVLLQNDIKSVVCVDVGKNQLHPIVREDERVKVFEECDIRNFKSKEHFDIAVCDVSFISLYQILPCFKQILCDEFIMLFKPQFEVGIKAKRNKKGVLQDLQAIFLALESFCKDLRCGGFEMIHTQKSILSGKEGNEEFFIYARKLCS